MKLSFIDLCRLIVCFNAVTWYQIVSILNLVGAKDDGSGGSGDNWSYKTCKAPVKSSPPTTQHPVFTGRMSFLSPNQQCQSTEWKHYSDIL